MCGILGLVGLNDTRAVDYMRFVGALATLRHRGPDGQVAVRVSEKILFGHTRLSIIDLSDQSTQPFTLDDRYWLIYNGEIFNYLELRAELEGFGVKFKTEGDVEVLLRAYIHWGAECVSRLNGMWAFAVYDVIEGTLFASRDRFGIKPFNYVLHNGQFIFSSEIKAILHYVPELAEPNYRAIANFCRASVGAQHSETWFAKIRRLQPGCNLSLTTNGELKVWRYWDYPPAKAENMSVEDARREYSKLFEDAVRLRMRSDVPLGITLSSGVDSTSIASVMQKIDPSPHHSFTARFSDNDGSFDNADPGRVDESVVAASVARKLGLDAHFVNTDYADFVSELSRIIYHLESGNSSPAVIPLMQVLKKAREHLVVVLDGQGADELLGGYVSAVIAPAAADLIARGQFSNALISLKAYCKTYTLRGAALLVVRQATNYFPAVSRLQQRAQGFDRVYGPLLTGHVPLADFPKRRAVRGEGRLGRRLREQHSGGLINLLHYGDALSMANSIEARMPFLDHRLVEYVWPLPDDYKVRLGVGKSLHREAMRGLVDSVILDDHAKLGFPTPIAEQFRKEFDPGSGPVDILLSDRSAERGLFNPKEIKRLVAEHRSRRKDHGTLLFRLLSAELWFRVFIDPVGDFEGCPPVLGECTA